MSGVFMAGQQPVPITTFVVHLDGEESTTVPVGQAAAVESVDYGLLTIRDSNGVQFMAAPGSWRYVERKPT